MTDPIFGPMLGPIDVRRAVKATLIEWMETYLAAVERHYELPAKRLEVPDPRNYVTKDNGQLNKKPEEHLPCVVILCPGTAGDPGREGDGMYNAPYLVNVAVIASAKDEESSSDLAMYYALAVRSLLVQQGSLGGFARGTRWKGDRNDDLAARSRRTIAAGTNVFHVSVPNVAQKGAGLREPPADPYDPELPIAKEVGVDLIPEEIS